MFLRRFPRRASPAIGRWPVGGGTQPLPPPPAHPPKIGGRSRLTNRAPRPPNPAVTADQSVRLMQAVAAAPAQKAANSNGGATGRNGCASKIGGKRKTTVGGRNRAASGSRIRELLGSWTGGYPRSSGRRTSSPSPSPSLSSSLPGSQLSHKVGTAETYY